MEDHFEIINDIILKIKNYPIKDLKIGPNKYNSLLPECELKIDFQIYLFMDFHL